MVRKRTRKYESDENDSDSDIEFDVNHATQEPAPKKYSLRERKRTPMFTSDFDYYGLDEEEEIKKQSSDDEDFEVEADVDTSKGCYESDTGPQNSEGLIDFEDIIRADIVVNKNKIDYDNLIQKTEIKLTQPKRRGRKPKNYVPPTPEENNCESESEIQTLTHLENKDQEESADISQPEINFCDEKQDNSVEKLENGDSDKIVDNETDPLAMKHSNNVEPVVVKPPEVIENVPKENNPTPDDDEDDDVIVLGEVKQDVIVLDD